MPTVKYFRPKGDIAICMFTDDYDGCVSYVDQVSPFLSDTNDTTHATRDGIEIRNGWAMGTMLIDKDTVIVKAFIGAGKPLVVVYPADHWLRSHQEISTVQHSEPTIDLEEIMWQMIKQAAADAPWMPPEYMMNDWVADVCDFLKDRHLYQKVE